MAVDHRQMALPVPEQVVAGVPGKGGVVLEAALHCGRIAVEDVGSAKALPEVCGPESEKPRRERTRATVVQSTVDFQVSTSWSAAHRLRASANETLAAMSDSTSSGKTKAKACDQCGMDGGKDVLSMCSLSGETDVG